MGKRLCAVLTGDLVDYSKLEDSERVDYVNCLREVLNNLNEINLKFEIFRGDSFQAILPSSRVALTAALIIRSYIVSRKLSSKKKIKPDVRIAVGVGSVDNYNEQNISSSDGEAFRNSGPELDRMDTKRQRVAIKTNWTEVNRELKTECVLLDAITSKWRTSQAEAVYYTLSGKNQVEIAAVMNITQGNVSSKLNSANFDAVRVMIDRYKELIDGGTVHRFLNQMNMDDPGAKLKCLANRHPDSPVFHREYGLYLSEKGKHPEAVEEYQKVLETDPDDYDTRTVLIHDLMKDGNSDEAEEECKKALRIREDDAYALFILGNINEEKGNFPEAEKYYRKACIHTEPDNLSPKIGFSSVLIKQNKSEEAEDNLIQFLTICPFEVYFIQKLYEINIRKGNEEKAHEYVINGIESLKNEIEVSGEDTELLFDLANLYYLIDKYPEAEIILLKIIKNEPDNQYAHRLIARIYSLRGEYVKAEEEIEILIGLDPDNFTNHLLKGQILQQMERYQDAKKEFEMLIKLNPDESLPYFSLGITEYALGNIDQAKKHLKKAHEMNSSLPMSEDMLSYLDSGSSDGGNQ